MPALPLTTGIRGRQRLELPDLRLQNAFYEKTPGGPTADVRTTRPGLTANMNLSPGPILRSFQLPQVFNGDPFNVSGNQLYRAANNIGSVGYGQSPRMAAAGDQLAVVAGGGLYVYDGATLTPIITFDDGVSRLPLFSGVSVLYNIFIYPVAGSNQFFFSNTGDATTINAANFSTAQTSPDPIVESAVLAEELYFFKPTGTEIWDFTGSLTAPFAESLGRTYSKGTAVQASVAQLDNALFWVGNDFTVYRTSTVPLRVSTPYIEDRLKAAGASISQVTACTFSMEGHVFYVLNIPSLGLAGESYAYDCQTQEWSRWGSQSTFQAEVGQWLGRTAAGYGQGIQIGSAVDGRVWSLDETNHTDDGQPIQVEVCGALWMGGGRTRCANVSLHCVRGVGTSATSNPIVKMRYSDDGGRTFTSWRQASLGTIGGYRYKATWRSLGTMQQPGRLFDFQVSDPVLVAIEGASYNEGRV